MQLSEQLSNEFAFIQTQKERLHSFQQANKEFSVHIEANASEMNSILHVIEDIGKTVASQLDPTTRAGDTPHKRRFSFTPFRTHAPLPRDILINQFQEEYSEVRL